MAGAGRANSAFVEFVRFVGDQETWVPAYAGRREARAVRLYPLLSTRSTQAGTASDARP